MWGNMKIAFNSHWQYEFQWDADEKTISITEKDIVNKLYTMTLSVAEARSLHSFLNSVFNKGEI